MGRSDRPPPIDGTPSAARCSRSPRCCSSSPTTHALHGDAQVYLSTLDKGLRAAGAAHREPLPQFLIDTGAPGPGGPAGGSPALTFRLFGLFTGLLFLGITIALAARLSDTVRGRTLLASAVVGGGAWPLFAGHAELYGFALVAIVLLAFFGLRWIDGRGRLIWVALAYAACGLCHAQLAASVPGFLLLVWEQWRRGERRSAGLALLTVPVVVGAALIVLHYPFSDLGHELSRGDAFLPPLGEFGGRTAYSLFSGAHVIELLDVGLLLSPLLLPLLPLSVGSHRGSRGESLKLRFLATIAAGPMLFAIAANPELGMVRDWDLYALAFTLVTLWVAAAALPQIELAGHRDRGIGSEAQAAPAAESAHPIHRSFTARFGASANALVGLLFLTGVLHGATWLMANHHEDYAESRLRRVVANPALFGPVSRAEVWRYLAASDARRGDGRSAAGAYLEAIHADPTETIPYRQLATMAVQGALSRGRSAAEGLDAYHEALAQGPFGPAEAHLGGVIAAVQTGQDSLAILEGQAMLEADPDKPEYQAVWGDLARRAGQIGEATAWYDRALKADPNQVRALLGMACLAGMEGDRTTMTALAQRAIRAYPFSTQAQQFRSLLERREGISTDECRAMFFSR
ncbi:MAG: hypothetical protein R3E12_06960 [Candidatus Eisenbacteria bacterium]